MYNFSEYDNNNRKDVSEESDAMRHRRCISAILMSFVLFLQPVYAVPPEENQPENSRENNTENEKRQQEQISAPSAILMEASTGQIIYEKNPD